ncbi:BPSL0761 family protein [Pseudomonas sp. MAHUQ-62]|uniref:BPSL0761 family protein n=1 Tax=Pseudomonas sp. GCM10023245 TaxID=3252652 RepID=UPI003620599F
MTVPHERTRAVIQTREFLQRLEGDLSISEEMRCMATQLLRHYPTRGEVFLQGAFEEHLSKKLIISPFFSSTLSYQHPDISLKHRNLRNLCKRITALLVSHCR